MMLVRNSPHPIRFTQKQVYCFKDFISHVVLFNNMQDLLPNDSLTLFCETSIITDPTTIHGRPSLAKPDCSLSADFGRLFESQDFAEVILSASGKELRAPKAILSARSPVFSAMFRHNIVEKVNNRVEVGDVRYDVLQQVLHFIYTGRAPNL
jgi:speckle-type POZ protein